MVFFVIVVLVVSAVVVVLVMVVFNVVISLSNENFPNGSRRLHNQSKNPLPQNLNILKNKDLISKFKERKRANFLVVTF